MGVCFHYWAGISALVSGLLFALFETWKMIVMAQFTRDADDLVKAERRQVTVDDFERMQRV
jgi:hypothetical protein